MIPDKELEVEIQTVLLQEYSLVEDMDQNGAIFMRDFTFFDYKNNHILNSYRYNIDSYTGSSRRIDRFTISFFDYAQWYNTVRITLRGLTYADGSVNPWSNNPSNYMRYYCSRSTGPAWSKCRTVAAGAVGNSASETIGPSVCKVEKISDHLLKYTESDNGLVVPLNNGMGCIYWEFDYERV